MSYLYFGEGIIIYNKKSGETGKIGAAFRILLETQKPYTIVECEEDGCVAWLRLHPGCISYGDTPEEALKNLEEAKELYFETKEKRNERACCLGTRFVRPSRHKTTENR